VVVKFNAEYASADGGAVLLKAVDGALGVTATVAGCLRDRRQRGKVQHDVLEIRQVTWAQLDRGPLRRAPDLQDEEEILTEHVVRYGNDARLLDPRDTIHDCLDLGRIDLEATSVDHRRGPTAKDVGAIDSGRSIAGAHAALRQECCGYGVSTPSPVAGGNAPFSRIALPRDDTKKPSSFSDVAPPARHAGAAGTASGGALAGRGFARSMAPRAAVAASTPRVVRRAGFEDTHNRVLVDGGMMSWFQSGRAAVDPHRGSPASHRPVDVGDPLAIVFERARSSARGLTTAEARERFDEVGPNEPATRRRGAVARELLLLLANPLVIILLIASLVSALLGETINAAIIVVMVVLSITLNFAQTYRSQRAAERLREQVAPSASVLRDGRLVEIPRRELVPGDVVHLAAGDRVPADARLIETRDLHVQDENSTSSRSTSSAGVSRSCWRDPTAPS
jgi:hypothetical protein